MSSFTCDKNITLCFVQDALLKKYMLELTQSFMIPLVSSGDNDYTVTVLHCLIFLAEILCKMKANLGFRKSSLESLAYKPP